MPLGKLSFLHTLFLENEEQPSEKMIIVVCVACCGPLSCCDGVLHEGILKVQVIEVLLIGIFSLN